MLLLLLLLTCLFYLSSSRHLLLHPSAATLPSEAAQHAAPSVGKGGADAASVNFPTLAFGDTKDPGVGGGGISLPQISHIPIHLCLCDKAQPPETTGNIPDLQISYKNTSGLTDKHGANMVSCMAEAAETMTTQTIQTLAASQA